MTVQNGLGAEEIVRATATGTLISAVTFMSGTRHEDTHVEYILDTETWLGPSATRRTTLVDEIAGADRRVGPEGAGVRRPAARRSGRS